MAGNTSLLLDTLTWPSTLGHAGVSGHTYRPNARPSLQCVLISTKRLSGSGETLDCITHQSLTLHHRFQQSGDTLKLADDALQAAAYATAAIIEVSSRSDHYVLLAGLPGSARVLMAALYTRPCGGLYCHHIWRSNSLRAA